MKRPLGKNTALMFGIESSTRVVEVEIPDAMRAHMAGCQACQDMDTPTFCPIGKAIIDDFLVQAGINPDGVPQMVAAGINPCPDCLSVFEFKDGDTEVVVMRGHDAVERVFTKVEGPDAARILRQAVERAHAMEAAITAPPKTRGKGH